MSEARIYCGLFFTDNFISSQQVLGHSREISNIEGTRCSRKFGSQIQTFAECSSELKIQEWKRGF